jgi:anti-anti-sigma factor
LEAAMDLYQPILIEDHGVHVLSFRRDELGNANLDQVRHYFAQRFLDETGPYTHLVIDLAGVATLDSACLGPLVQRLRQTQEQSGRLALCGVDSPALEEIFSLTRFDKVFPFYKTRSEAVTALTA